MHTVRIQRLEIFCFHFYRTYRLHPIVRMHFWESFNLFHRVRTANSSYLRVLSLKKLLVQMIYPLFYLSDAQELSANSWLSFFYKIKQTGVFRFFRRNLLLVQPLKNLKKGWNRMKRIIDKSLFWASFRNFLSGVFFSTFTIFWSHISVNSSLDFENNALALFNH